MDGLPTSRRWGIMSCMGADERVFLDVTSWVDVRRSWLSPKQASVLYDAVVGATAWRQGRMWRSGRFVDEQRLGGSWRPGQPPPHPMISRLNSELERIYGKRFHSVAFAWYRDARDGIPFHRDRELQWLDDTLVAVLTLGAPRPWLVRPRRHSASQAVASDRTVDLSPAAGDLLVMGGRTQADWEHSVPALDAHVGGRIALQWRWTSRLGRRLDGD